MTVPGESLVQPGQHPQSHHLPRWCMLRHADTFRSGLRRVRPPPSAFGIHRTWTNINSSIEIQTTVVRSAAVLPCRLHHDSNTNRRRQRQTISSHCTQRSNWCVEVYSSWKTCGVVALMGSRRMAHGGGHVSAESRSGTVERRKETMDEETRKSMRRGGRKTSESMGTVKVSLCKSRR